MSIFQNLDTVTQTFENCEEILKLFRGTYRRKDVDVNVSYILPQSKFYSSLIINVFQWITV